MKPAKLTFATRLALGLGLPLLLLIAYALYAMLQLQRVGEISERLSAGDRAKTEAAQKIHASTDTLSDLVMALISAPLGNAPAASINEKQQAANRDLDQALATLEKLSTQSQDRDVLAELKRRRQAHAVSSERVVKLVQENLRPEASLLFIGETIPALNALQQSIQALSALQRKTFERGSIAAARTRLIWGAAAAVLLGLLWSVWLMRGTTRQLRAATQVAQQLAAGELDHPIPEQAQDELGRMLLALGELQQNLRALIEQVQADAHTLVDSTRALAQPEAAQMDRSTEQGIRVEQASASMQALAGALRHSTESGQQAQQLASAAASVAERGGEVVTRVVDTMQAIHKSSARIADIIGVIDGIAFQTNILALNAAVEAARAGDQGRGFAVVAAEVRSLAGRSAAAAKEIKQLINESVGNVAAGNKLVEQAGRTMQEVVAQVRQVAQTMAQITSNTREQDTDFSQLQQALQALEQMAADNASQLDRSAATAAELEQQARDLAGNVGVYRLGSGSLRLV